MRELWRKVFKGRGEDGDMRGNEGRIMVRTHGKQQPRPWRVETLGEASETSFSSS